MSEIRHTLQRVRSALLAGTLAAIAGPAAGQGMHPPIPGPFPVLPGAFVAAPIPTALAPAATDPAIAVTRPLFTAPAEAMRLPYWMQAPTPPTPEAGSGTPAATGETATGSVGASARATGSVGMAGQATIQRPAANTGYAVPAPRVGLPAPGVAPGYGAMPAPAPAGGWGQQPRWGYGAPAGWAPTPYAPQPGWSGWTFGPPEAPQ